MIVAEIGTEMGRFGSPERLASWAKLCPEKNESGGKEHSAKIGHGNKALQAALVQAANALAVAKKSYLSALYHRLASRRGKNKAVIAVAHAILVIAYHLLDRKDSYRDLGPNYFDQRNKEAVRRRLVRRLQDLGYKVTAEPNPRCSLDRPGRVFSYQPLSGLVREPEGLRVLSPVASAWGA